METRREIIGKDGNVIGWLVIHYTLLEYICGNAHLQRFEFTQKQDNMSFEPPNFEISERDLAGVTSIGYKAFSNCTGLTSVAIPEGVTNIARRSFKGCTALTEVLIPNSVTNIGSAAFCGCTALTEVVIPGGVTNIAHSLFKGCTGLTKVVMPNSIKNIDQYAFSDCTALTEAVIPNSVTSIEDSVFSGCAGLAKVMMPHTLKNIDQFAFSDCTALTEVLIPNGVTNIGYGAFNGCTALTKVVIPNSVTSISAHALDSCINLTEVVIPNSVTSIGAYAFSNCTGLTSLKIPGNVTNIGGWAFSDCISLTTIDIQNGVESIGDRAFISCTSLATINIPTTVKHIGQAAFSDCTDLTKVNIPNSVTSISHSAFRSCTGLNKIVIPAGSLRNQFLEEYPDFSDAVKAGDKYVKELFISLGKKLLFDDYWPLEVGRQENLSFDERYDSLIDYYLKENNSRGVVFSDSDVEIIKGVMTCIDYRNNKNADTAQALYKQLHKILSLGQMNALVAQLCEDASISLSTYQQDDDALLECIAYLSTVDLNLNQYMYFQTLLPGYINSYLNAGLLLDEAELDWNSFITQQNDILVNGPAAKQNKITKLLNDVAWIQNDHDVDESLKLAAFRGDDAPSAIKNMADNAVSKNIDVWYDAVQTSKSTQSQNMTEEQEVIVSPTSSGSIGKQSIADPARHIYNQETIEWPQESKSPNLK